MKICCDDQHSHKPCLVHAQEPVQLHMRTVSTRLKHFHLPEMFRSMSSETSLETPNSRTAGPLLPVLDIQLQIYESHETKLRCHDK